MINWMSKYERKIDEKREKELNDKLDELYSKYEKVENPYGFESKKIILKILNIYDTLDLEAMEYDKKECLRIKQELEKIKYIDMKKEFNKTYEAKSWNEYREEEDGR